MATASAADNNGYSSSAEERSGGGGHRGRRGEVHGTRRYRVARASAKGVVYVDYKDVDSLRRLMSPNGKIYSAKRLGVSAREQRMISQAIKRARYMGLLPYTNATL